MHEKCDTRQTFCTVSIQFQWVCLRVHCHGRFTRFLIPIFHFPFVAKICWIAGERVTTCTIETTTTHIHVVWSFFMQWKPNFQIENETKVRDLQVVSYIFSHCITWRDEKWKGKKIPHQRCDKFATEKENDMVNQRVSSWWQWRW